MKKKRDHPMKKQISDQMPKFLLFALPAYWTIALEIIVLAVWRVEFHDPDVVMLAGLNVAILIAAAALMKKQYWVCAPMILLGGYMWYALHDEQHMGEVITYYSIYLILHYCGCAVYGLKSRTKS